MSTMSAATEQAGDRGVIDYSLRWRAQGVYPGSHRGAGGAAAGLFRALVPFERAPDMRRLDLRRSMRDPYGQWYVKEYQPRLSVQIYALVDVSASMAWRDDDRSKLDVAGHFCDLLARAAHRNGDSFGLYACGADLLEESSLPSNRNRAVVSDMVSRLRTLLPTADSAVALGTAAEYLQGPRKLVFLLSDFLFPEQQTEQILAALSNHDVIPVVLQDYSVSDLPNWGFTELADLETGQRRFAIIRPSLKQRWLQESENRRNRLDALFGRYVNRPFRVERTLDVEALNTYLLER